MLTWTANPVSYEQAFEAGIASLPPGVKTFLDSGMWDLTGSFIELREATDGERFHFTGEFYANDLGPVNLDLLAAFFEEYPDYADKAFLSVKVTWSSPISGMFAAG